MLGTRTLLGLAIDEFGIVAAEVTPRGGRPDVRRVGQLTFEAKLSAETAKELGQQLRQFLRANHFSSKHAVVGIPTKWIVTKEIAAPPATADALAGMLSIQAERAFSLNASDLVFDYIGRPSASESSKVMLLAARRQIVDDIKELTTSAGLHVEAMTVSALAFGKLLSGKGSEVRYGLYARPTYCEFWSQANGQLRTIKHVPMTSTNGTPPDRAEQLTSAIQRLILLSGEQRQKPPHEVTVYDAHSHADGLIDRLNTQLKPHILINDGRIDVLPDRMGTDEDAQDAQSVAAAAVAMAGAERPPIDFLNPRLGRKKTSSRKRIVTWAAAAAVIVVATVAAVAYDWVTKQAAIDDYRAQLDAMAPEIEVAQAMMDRMSYARSWISEEPTFLQCLLRLTEVFPQRGTIWARNLGLSESGRATLMGRAVDGQSFDETFAALKRNPAFANVQMTDLDETRSPVEFTVTFTYQGAK